MLCRCKCGEEASKGKMFLPRHHVRTMEWRKKHALALTGKKYGPETSAKKSASLKETWKDKNNGFHSSKRSDKLSAHMTRRNLEGDIKLIPSHRRWKCGRLVTKKAGKVWYRSSWEQLFIELLDSSKLVKSFEVEPFGISYMFKGKQHCYHPDFIVTLCDGRKFLVELKAWSFNSPQNKAKFKAAQSFCLAKGVEFKLFTEKVESLSNLVH